MGRPSKDAYEHLEASRIAIENASRAWAEERDELLDRIDDLNHADEYVVQKRNFEHPHLGKCAHLSIRRDDREPVSDWRDKQAIKNQLVGPECEGLELYPAESRLVDTANQYHLWVVCDPTSRIPFGWTERVTLNESIGGSIQRPLEEMQT